MQPFRLTLFAPNLAEGGAERVLARLAGHWASRGHDVTVVTLAEASPLDFPLPNEVRRVGLRLVGDSAGLLGAIRSNLRRVSAIRSAFRSARPDVVVSFIEQANVLALLAARPLGIPVVISERTDPARHVAGRAWSFLRRRVYRRCEALVVLTDETAAVMQPLMHGRPISVIPNGIVAPPTQPTNYGKESEQRDPHRVVAVGRLSAAKGYDRLIEAFAIFAKNHPTWRLALVGDGPEKGSLTSQVERLSLADRVEFRGRVKDPSATLAKAAVFALTSRYEGFPNALLEAMAAGLPAVAFDGPSAVRQIIRHEVDGLLVPEGNVAAFATALDRLAADEVLRQRMGHAAREVASRFSLDDFFARWDDVVASAANRNFSQPLAR